MDDVVIRVEGLGKHYRLGERDGRRYDTLRDRLADAVVGRLRRRRAAARDAGRRADSSLWALHDVSFTVRRGEVVGIVGRNGAGKSTLLKVLSRITPPTVGEATIRGRVGSLLEVGTGFHPELTGRENVFLNGAILGMRRSEVQRKFDEIAAFAEVERFVDTPVKHYSSGMYLRLAFAVAAHLEPDILIVDEVLAVGDAEFQKKCLGKMGEVADAGRTVLFVSHNMHAVQRLCTRALLLVHGRLELEAETSRVVQAYLTSGTQEVYPGQWADLSQAVRRGCGQARVVSLQYRSPNAAIGGQPYADGPLEVTLAIHSDAPRVVGSVAVTLLDQQHTKLVNVDTLEQGRSLSLQAGLNVVRLRIRSLHLKPGTYVLATWLATPPGTLYDFVEAACKIEVADLAARELGMRPHGDGCVTCAFDVLQPDAEELDAVRTLSWADEARPLCPA